MTTHIIIRQNTNNNNAGIGSAFGLLVISSAFGVPQSLLFDLCLFLTIIIIIIILALIKLIIIVIIQPTAY